MMRLIKPIAVALKGKGLSTEFLGHRFEDRQGYTIGPELLAAAKCLDEEIVIPSYDDLYLAFHGVMPGEELPATKAAEPAPQEQDIPSERAEEQAAPAGRRMLRTPAPEETPAEEPAAEAAAPEEKVNKCIGGGVFGQDADKLPKCNECEDDIWQECATLAKKAEEAKTEPAAGGRRLQR
jgi:hypothetical protein